MRKYGTKMDKILFIYINSDRTHTQNEMNECDVNREREEGKGKGRVETVMETEKQTIYDARDKG